MKRLGILLGILIIISIAIPVLASSWTGTILVSNNTSTSYSMLSVLTSANVTYMVSQNFISSSGNDTVVQSAGVNVPFLLATDKITIAVPIGANTNNSFQFVTGQTPQANPYSIVTGYGGYVTTNDTASLELSSNWSNPMDVYVTNTDGDIAYKSGAYETRYSYSTSNITSYILGQNTSNQTPSADGFMDTLSFTGATNWQSVQASDGTYVWTSTSGIDFYQVTPSSIDTTNLTSIDYLTVSYYAKNQNAINAGGIQSYIYLSGSNTTGASRSLTNIAYQLFSDNMSRPGGGLWTYSDLANIQIGIAMSQDAVHAIYCDQIYVDVHYSYRYKSVTATGISTGNMTVTPQYLSNLVSNSSFESGGGFPTGWTIFGAGATANQSITQVKYGTYSANVTRAGVDCTLYQQLPSPASYNNKTLTRGAWAYSTVPNTTRVDIFDDTGATYSSFHTGSGTWEWLTVTKTLGGATTFIQLDNQVVNSNTTSYFDGEIVSETSTLPNQYYNFNLSINGVIQGQSAVDGAVSVNDTSNNIVWGSNVTPYFNSIKMVIGGTEKLWYQPNTIISGTKLPDRDGTKDGDITWGSNPSGVTSSLSSFEASTQTSTVSNIPDGVQDIAPLRTDNSTNVNPQTAVPPVTPITPLMQFLAGQYAYNIPEFILWMMGFWVASVIVFAITLGLFNHIGAAGILASGIFGLGIVLLHFPQWYLSLSVLGMAVSLVQENRG